MGHGQWSLTTGEFSGPSCLGINAEMGNEDEGDAVNASVVITAAVGVCWTLSGGLLQSMRMLIN